LWGRGGRKCLGSKDDGVKERCVRGWRGEKGGGSMEGEGGGGEGLRCGGLAGEGWRERVGEKGA